jgi:hypothetical protein
MFSLPAVIDVFKIFTFGRSLWDVGLYEHASLWNEQSTTANLPERLNIDTFSHKILCQIPHIFLKRIGLRQHVIHAAATEQI